MSASMFPDPTCNDKGTEALEKLKEKMADFCRFEDHGYWGSVWTRPNYFFWIDARLA